MLKIILLFTPLFLFSQQNPDYFPSQKGNLWEYSYFDGYRGDTLQTRIIFDSTDTKGNSYFKLKKYIINPIEDMGTRYFMKDTSGRIYATSSLFDPLLLEFDPTKPIDKPWIADINQDDSLFQYVTEFVRDTSFFGKNTVLYQVLYWVLSDTSSIPLTYFEYANDFGLISQVSTELSYSLFLRGAIINGKTYGLVTITSVRENDISLPKTFEIINNYPNPFNPSTTIKYRINIPSKVRISILNIAGKIILDTGSIYKRVGNHQFPWEGTDENGNMVSSGIYIFSIIAGNQRRSHKISLLR